MIILITIVDSKASISATACLPNARAAFMSSAVIWLLLAEPTASCSLFGKELVFKVNSTIFVIDPILHTSTLTTKSTAAEIRKVFICERYYFPTCNVLFSRAMLPFLYTKASLSLHCNFLSGYLISNRNY